ncbi:hypothetical protein GALMADRAFT_146771 [Galerina marginata CBS 339.88]|uniref:Uncharacterized protein n=1 Tax=Galerina marginata (strain CBS 339.88) TaxID=685588 RepID=A0A067SMQ1_GALM3|nr:hypothetical protein GALMADRAFT_146771 [Galerina marginata CBS 339.88]
MRRKHDLVRTRFSARIRKSAGVANAPAAAVYGAAELLDMILELSCWTALMNMAQANRDLRFLVLDTFRKRVRRVLEHYIPSHEVEGFFELLHSTQSGIVGGVVRTMMVCHLPAYVGIFPTHLDIVVPHGHLVSAFSRWRRYLGALGYTASNVTLRVGGTKDFHSRTIELSARNDRQVSVRLTESRSTKLLPVVLGGPNTSNFFVLTSDRLYCLYPELFRRNINIASRPRRRNECFTSFNYGLRVLHSTRDLGLPCGLSCPAVWRSTLSLPGVGIWHWRMLDADAKAANVVIDDVDYLWRVQGASELRARYHLSDKYIARVAVLADCAWRAVLPDLDILCDGAGFPARHLTVVGAVDPENLFMGRLGDFHSRLASYESLASAKLRFSLTEPKGHPGFQVDFKNAFDHLEVLQSQAHGHYPNPKEDALGTLASTDMPRPIDEYAVEEVDRPYLDAVRPRYDLAGPLAVKDRCGKTVAPVAFESLFSPGTVLKARFSLFSHERHGCSATLHSVAVLDH